MNEIWKPIEGFEGLYEVSSLGRVKSYRQSSTGVLMNSWLDAYGYLRVDLRNKTIRKGAVIHRLVAAAFIPRVEGKDCVNHIDGCKTNNRVENLEWCTRAENNRHAYETGLNKGLSKEASLRGREAAKKVLSKKVIRNDGEQFESSVAASKAIGASPTSVSDAILKGRSLYGFQFKYAK